MKSLAMLKFNRISPPADFYSKLDILNKNVLYVTHEVDKIKKILEKLTIDNGLQAQVNEYFEAEDKEPD